MEGNRKNLGTTRSPHEVVLKEDLDDGEEPDDSESFPPEENTNPGMDPEVENALAALRRVQVTTRRRASDIEELLIKRKTPFPR